MYKWTVEITEDPLQDAECYDGIADDYEEAVENAAEMAEANEPYKVIITITKEV